MALKFTIDKLEEVEEPLRAHYVADGDKFRLDTQDPRVSEMRESAINAKKERDALKARFDGIDPDAVKADRLKLNELLAAKPDERIAELEGKLAAEATARASVQKKADRALLREVIGGKALKAGAQPAALDMLLDKAESVFGVVNDVVAATSAHSTNRPGEKLSVDEWLTAATKEFPFLFKASGGGGSAHRSSPFSGRTGGARELVNPTPQQLGEHGAAISRGEIKVVYTT